MQGIPDFLHTQADRLTEQSRKKPRGVQSHRIRGLRLRDEARENRAAFACTNEHAHALTCTRAIAVVDMLGCKSRCKTNTVLCP